MKSLYIIIFLTVMFQCKTQAQGNDESKYALKVGKSDTINHHNSILIIQEIDENAYNEKLKEFGRTFKEVKGFKLAEALIVLAKEANEVIKIRNLSINPEVGIRIEFKDVTFEDLWGDVLADLAKYFDFNIYTEDILVQKNTLKISNPEKLNKQTIKKPKPGVAGSTKIEKNGKVLLSNCDLAYLAKWISNTFNLIVETEKIKNNNKYNFEFPSDRFDEIKAILDNQYGITLTIENVEKSAWIVQ